VTQQGNSGTEKRSARILVAEDHRDSRDALQALLEAHGYDVAIAVDGREAIDQAQSVRPDLILMDIMMPVIDGLSATRELRGRPELDAVPIIAVTAMEGGRERAMEAGCDDHIAKPIDLPSLFQKVRWWVEHRRGAGSRVVG
jgi:two-component system, cell cycle response regulator DivK